MLAVPPPHCCFFGPFLPDSGFRASTGLVQSTATATATSLLRSIVWHLFVCSASSLMGVLNLPQFRYHGPWVQMLIAGLGVGSSAGIYVALNLLGAGGGKPDSAQVVQVVNATLCAGKEGSRNLTLLGYW